MLGTDIKGLQCELFPQGLLQNVKGKAVAYHAASLDLWFLNNGNLSTCVHWQGVSIVRISWASPAARSDTECGGRDEEAQRPQLHHNSPFYNVRSTSRRSELPQ